MTEPNGSDFDYVAPEQGRAFARPDELVENALADQYARRIQVHLVAEHWEAAHDLIEKYKRVSAKPEAKPVGDKLLDMPLAETSLGVRSLNSLERHLGIIYVRQLMAASAETVMNINGGGLFLVTEIQRAIRELGLTWPATRPVDATANATGGADGST